MLLSIANSRPRNMESIGVESLYPPALRESAQSLVSFIGRYYDYLNTSGLPSNEIANITRDKDIDIVSNKYLTEIQSLIARNIPNSRAIDKVTLYRIIIQYYRTRGSEDSIHTFFKIFFDEIVDIFYPRDYLFDLSGGAGKWAPLNIPSLRQTYTNPNKVTLQIKSDYRIGPFPVSNPGPYTVTLKAISKYVWTYGGGEKSFALPYIEKTNIAAVGDTPVYRWVYRYKDELEVYSTNDTVWPDEAIWETLSRNIEYSLLPAGVSLLESGSVSILQNGELALLENAVDGELTDTKNIEYNTLTIAPIVPTFEDEELVDESGKSLVDESVLSNLLASERIVQNRGSADDAADVAMFGITTEDGQNLQVELTGEIASTGIVTEESGGIQYITENKNIEYYHTFEVRVFQEYTTKIGDYVHSLEDVTDPALNTNFVYSKVYRSIDLDPITWVEINKNTDVWTYRDNKSFASDLYKLQDGEYWQKYSYRIRCQLPQEDWANDYLRFVHPAGLKLFSAILYEFVAKNSWLDSINYVVKKPQDSYRWLNVYDPPVVGYHSPRYQPGWLTGNERLLTIILEYIKSRGSEDDYIRLITYIILLFTQNNNPRNKTVYTDYQGWLKYLDPNELICGISDKTIEEASSPWLESKRNTFSNVSSFINFKIKDKSYYPWFYSELIQLDTAYEDTDPKYFEGAIQSILDEDEPNYNTSSVEDKEELVYRYVFENERGDDYFVPEDDTAEGSDAFITEGQTNLKTVLSLVSNKTTLKENEVVRFYARTQYMAEGTTLYWSVSNANVSQQFGECVVKNEIAVFKLVPLVDMSSGTPQTFTATIRQGSHSGPILAHSSAVTVNDNTTVPTYSVTSTITSTIEGAAIPFTVLTTNVDDNEALYYVASRQNDLTPPAGGLVIKDNAAAFTLIATPDTLDSEGPEQFNIKLYACGSAGLSVATSADITILDAYKLWEFFPAVATTTLSNFKVTTSDSSTIKIGWTDGSLEQTVNSAAAVTHTYS